MNSLLSFFLRRRITTFMLFFGLFLWGMISVRLLPVSLMPTTESPALTIVTKYPGVAPSRIEEILTKPIEEQIVGVGGIESIYSTSEEGESRVNVVFSEVRDLTLKAVELKSKIDLIRDTFPREVEEPAVIRYDPSDRPIFIVKLESSSYSLKDLREIAENKIKKRLERVDGVSEIRVGGGRYREITVEVNRDILNHLGIPLSEVMERIRTANVDLPAGRIQSGEHWINVRVLGKFSAMKIMEEITVRSPAQDKLIKLKDIANVYDGHRDREDISRENGNENVTIYVQKAGEANTLSVCEGLREELSQISFPYVKTEVTYDQSEFIKISIDRVSSSAATGGLIAILVMFLFLRNFRATLIVGASIPLSIVITFAVMFLTKTGINVMTLAGLALGAGLLIDNSVVVLDRIFFLRQQADAKAEALAKLKGEVSSEPKEKKKKKSKKEESDTKDSESPKQEPIVDPVDQSVLGLYKELAASTLTNIAVFFPFFIGSKELKQLYGGMSYTVSFSILISLCVSLFFLPQLAKIFLSKSENFKPFRFDSSYVLGIPWIGKRLNFLVIIGSRIGDFYTRYFSNKFNLHRLRKFYLAFLSGLLRKPQLAYLSLIGLIVAGSAITPFLKQEYVDPVDAGEIRASVELETGTHLEATSDRVKRIEDLIKTVPDVEKINSKIEKWHADLYIKLKPPDKRSKSSDELIASFKGLTEPLKDVFVYYVENGSMDSGRELDIEFIGDDPSKLKDIAREAAGKIKSITGIQETVLRFRDGKQEFRLNVFQDKMALTGLSSQEVGNYVRTAIQGSIPTKFIEESKEIDIRVRFREVDRIDINQVAAYKIPGAKTSISIAELSVPEEKEGETKIYRKNKRRMVTITAKLGSLDLGSAVVKIGEVLKEIQMPDNYYFEFGSSYKKLEKNKKEMGFMIFLAIFLIYCILASLFESLKIPWILLVSVPLGVFADLILLFVFRMSLNISVYIGFILLAGIAINNSIMLVDQTIHILHESKAVDRNFALIRATLKSASERLRPILMTTLTTVTALVPTMLDFGEGSQLWRPLAITVFSGLSISTVLTLLFVPVLFFASERKGNGNKRNWIRMIKEKFKKPQEFKSLPLND
ncbi:efflux RND transporter permease subunit [Leptospira kmetyi]|uniref:Transporter n=1 Tax=Leptospira kmetyi TaxID=408139 RepID=A0A5F1XGU1_9LEPT|nr:efflux RND transporter permease subunit [Leptospira kmetyi]AYV56421.1 efflux RND transporter permease subunit [Leptospira kmetyi]PJZ28930.1 transporter [Leptospira kmetyi]TGK10728.1 efflux RND transporter permease subunit [Leptospira kmetyi]TGK25020.1 efflux RND transporter permease subunit [Leptospira kmetyi]